MRVAMPSKSMLIGATGATTTFGSSRPVFGSTFASLFGSASAFAVSFLLSALAAFSSSLSLISGDGKSRRSTAIHTVRVTRLSSFCCENQLLLGPALVDAKKYRYLPLLSNTGWATSDRPSVTGIDLFCSTE